MNHIKPIVLQDDQVQRAIVNFVNVCISCLTWLEKARVWILGATVLAVFILSMI